MVMDPIPSQDIASPIPCLRMRSDQAISPAYYAKAHPSRVSRGGHPVEIQLDGSPTVSAGDPSNQLKLESGL